MLLRNSQEESVVKAIFVAVQMGFSQARTDMYGDIQNKTMREERHEYCNRNLKTHHLEK